MGLLVNFLEKFYAKQPVLADSEPEWMNSLRETLLNPSAHTNVVLFIVRLVINLKSIFQPYAKFWYKNPVSSYYNCVKTYSFPVKVQIVTNCIFAEDWR